MTAVKWVGAALLSWLALSTGAAVVACRVLADAEDVEMEDARDLGVEAVDWLLLRRALEEQR